MKYPNNLEEIVIASYIVNHLESQKEYINNQLKDGFKILDIIIHEARTYIYMYKPKNSVEKF